MVHLSIINFLKPLECHPLQWVVQSLRVVVHLLLLAIMEKSTCIWLGHYFLKFSIKLGL
ncbi:hypothetical protein HanHA300_Chr11g0415681 [Helianthus annuus]|nr:hypothetical protein HanHA300_Chr11g0415681 [Helianthus annuus]KAJ0518643.1 hypothetical protein HanHA89_Chr11g0439751 [Helianthus annuus]KAJ0686685.1 hypothetical protein HanLR1_Chr11g0417511 [Helianthus annuus]